MEKVLRDADTTIIDQGSGAVPYLPLDGVVRRNRPTTPPAEGPLMPRNSSLLLFVGAAVLFAPFNTFYVVRQDQQAIVLRFGQFTRAINAPGTEEPGLYLKIPLVDSVVTFDKRGIWASR